jgi:hypothetical protein
MQIVTICTITSGKVHHIVDEIVMGGMVLETHLQVPSRAPNINPQPLIFPPSGHPERGAGAGGTRREGQPRHADCAAPDARRPERGRRLRAPVKNNRNSKRNAVWNARDAAVYLAQRVVMSFAGAMKRRTLAAAPTRTTTTPR